MERRTSPPQGRRAGLRLAHEQNQQISISTEVVRYDESVDVGGIETILEGNGKLG